MGLATLAAFAAFIAAPGTAAAGVTDSITWNVGTAAFDDNVAGTYNAEALVAYDVPGDGYAVSARLWRNGEIFRKVRALNGRHTFPLTLAEGQAFNLQLCRLDASDLSIEQCSAKVPVVS